MLSHYIYRDKGYYTSISMAINYPRTEETAKLKPQRILNYSTTLFNPKAAIFFLFLSISVCS